MRADSAQFRKRPGTRAGELLDAKLPSRGSPSPDWTLSGMPQRPNYTTSFVIGNTRITETRRGESESEDGHAGLADSLTSAVRRGDDQFGVRSARIVTKVVTRASIAWAAAGPRKENPARASSLHKRNHETLS